MEQQILKKQLTKKAIEEQQRLQKHAEKRRIQKEREQEQIQKQVGNEVIAHVYPMMVDYYSGAEVMIKGILGLVLMGGAGILIYIIGYSIKELGLKDTLIDLKELMQEFEPHHILVFLMCILFFWGLSKFGKILSNYMKHTVSHFTEEYVHIQKYLQKDKYVTYEELENCIRKRKIRVHKGRLEIPYEGGFIHVYAIGEKIPIRLMELLEQKCGVEMPKENISDVVRRTGIGWSFASIMGIPLIVFGSYIILMGYIGEGNFTIKYLISLLFSPTNVLGLIGLCCVGIGLILKVIYFFKACIFFYKYKEFIKVSF